MADNKAVILELNEFMDAKQMTCSASTSISKGDLLKFSDDNTVEISSSDDEAYAGVAAHDKDGTDSSTSIGVYRPGQGNKFDMTCAGAIGLGKQVVLSGANLIAEAVDGDFENGYVIGQAEEAGSVGEVIVVYS